ncbi:hypothetical protein D9615_007991 [Tricholomella constricta]|uniref:C2H2-type domain-containing protein n=1 Tax=Tricholomella constricta TaxID=117010 RepID=A0A8H5H2E8_9AGAR|nr:hypothetical protein D9615_007991 [Tricholomella constricta]
MPGPSNIKKKRKSHKRGRQDHSKPRPSMVQESSASSSFNCDRDDDGDSCSSRSPSPARLLTPPPDARVMKDVEISPVEDRLAHGSDFELHGRREYLLSERKDEDEEAAAPIPTPQLPFIHDPGNGPRVRDTRAFLGSFFAQPPALSIPLCAEFAQEEVLQMLMTVLPEETALILWYNKSRATSRICPACQRLYRLGDILPNHLPDHAPDSPSELLPSSQLQCEQALSGLCSPVCFVVASFNYPGAIRMAWGQTEDELDDYTWALLNGPGENNAQGDVGVGLSMLMKMTRLHDLGLAQLCLGLDVEDVDDLAEEGGLEYAQEAVAVP